MTLILPTRERLVGRRRTRLHYRGIEPGLVRDVLGSMVPSVSTSQAPGDAAWADPSKIEIHDADPATVSLDVPNPTSEVFYAKTLANRAALPAGATVTAVTANFIAGMTGNISCALLQLVDHDGNVVGTDRKLSLVLAGATLKHYRVGYPGNTLTAEWGAAVAALTVANWQDADTGLMWRFSSASAGTVSIDYAWLELYWEA